MRFGVIVAARTGSSRLPGKALLPIQGIEMIAFQLRRLLPSQETEKIVLATTELAQDDRLVEIGLREGVEVYRGSQNDLVERFVGAAKRFDMDYVVRVTGDCPFTDHETLDYCLRLCRDLGGFDLASTKGLFPVGIDYEVYPAALMERLFHNAPLDVQDREHLTKYIYDHSREYDIRQLPPPHEWRSQSVFTVDEKNDYQFCKEIAERFSRPGFSIKQILDEVGS